MVTVNKGIYAYLNKLSNEDLDSLIGQIKAERAQASVKVPETKITAPAPKVSAKAVKFSDKMEQDRLRTEYRRLMEIHWTGRNGKVDEHMVDYCTKEQDIFVEIGGFLVGIEKPRIKTSFCFGYGQNGISTEEDTTRASKAADAVTNDEGKYFKSENLKEFDTLLKQLKDKDYRFVLKYRYRPENGTSNIMAVIPQISYLGGQPKPEVDGERYLTDAEVKLYTEVVSLARERFEKRLNTYLKRYGTSKLNSWSYLVD